MENPDELKACVIALHEKISELEKKLDLLKGAVHELVKAASAIDNPIRPRLFTEAPIVFIIGNLSAFRWRR